MMRDTLQGLCALHSALARMAGNVMDKSAMRYSAMADYCEHVMACGSAGFSYELLWEAVDTAIVGTAMHIPGQPFDRAPWRWMEAPQ